MKILVTGIAGQLGQDLADELNGRGHEVAGFDRVPEPPVACQYRQVDLTDRAAVLAAVRALATKVTDLAAAKLNSEADAFAEEHKDKAKDPEVLKNAYKKDPELAKSLVLNMKDPEPAKAPEPAKKPGEVETAATRILTNRAPVGPGAGMTKEQAREKLASLPHAEQAEFYRQNAALIDG